MVGRNVTFGLGTPRSIVHHSRPRRRVLFRALVVKRLANIANLPLVVLLLVGPLVLPHED